ncbi:probable protein phosphatase 2C 39 isoform X2 [Arachis duranensis]|uniref:protein-serine/threonine phosphatase n=1 Tax=Arachis duranensis TaxID=130453 RepID=A0A6P5NCA4_ARADU|nr:probable protein phosphatase 2C 39 isoform X2 [Arachis duranensis]
MFLLVSGLLTNILNRVDSATYKEISLLWGLKDEIDTLKNSLRIINAFLVDAENKQTQNNGIMEWLQQLRDHFFDARDILDEIECEALRNKIVKSQGSFKRKKSRLASHVDSVERERKHQDDLIEKKYGEDEDDGDVEDNTDEIKPEADEDANDDHREEAEYLLGDDGATAEGLHEGLLIKDGDEDSKLSARHFSHGYHLTEGKLNHGMEDYIFAQHKKLNGYDLGLYAIFDGHSGHDVAKYLQSHLFENILNEPSFWKKPVHAVKKVCKATNVEILENIADLRGGSTAVAAILIDGVKLLVANVGDSRAISCKNGIAKPITADHEPEKEKDLVETRGGCVFTRPGSIPRVDGQLAMTRAFGDGKLKEHITAEPDVMIRKIDDDTDFIILASDGLWKVMTNQDACDCIKDDVDDAKKAAKKLVKEAKCLGSCDDISCIVVTF